VNKRFAFTMIELVFVIVIMGILSKFGVEFLVQAYNNFILSRTHNTLQSQSASAVETIASRLQYRIKDSIISRVDATGFQPLLSSNDGDNARVLEWIAGDIEGFRGNALPLWSGIIDLDDSDATFLSSPMTRTADLDTQIRALSYGGSNINDAALYFIGSDSDSLGYGWNGTAITTQNNVMHPIQANAIGFASLASVGGDFAGVEVSEYYQLAWTAYAVVHSDDGNLNLRYDYQPWNGQSYTDGREALIMQNVSTFRFKAIGSVVKIQVCVDGNITDGGYSVCKEKTIF